MEHHPALDIFEANGGILRMTQALALGINRRTLYSLRDEGVINCVTRGVFRLSSLPPLSNPDLVTVALRVPQAVVCLVSALSHHGATTQIPSDVHIALPRGTKKPQLDYPPIQVHQFTGDALIMGVDVVEIDGVPVRIYNLAKTVVDCFRFRNSIGTDVAIEALKEAVQRRGISPAELFKYARACKVESIMIPYLEAM
jgi:predicted transcriptional regulator of viral defense system